MVKIWRRGKYKQYFSVRKPLQFDDDHGSPTHTFPSSMTQRKEDENYFHFSTIYFCHVTVRCTKALQKRDLFTFDQQRPQTQLLGDHLMGDLVSQLFTILRHLTLTQDNRVQNQAITIMNDIWVPTNNSQILKALGTVEPSTKMHNMKSFPKICWGTTWSE